MPGFRKYPSAKTAIDVKLLSVSVSTSDVEFLDWLARAFGIARSEALRRVIYDVRKQYAAAGLRPIDAKSKSSDNPSSSVVPDSKKAA